LDGFDAGFLDGDKSQICCDRRGIMASRANTQVVGHALKPLGKIEVQGTGDANQREYEQGNQERRAFEALKLHTVGLNKKPAQLKAALV
jgi:hypothetical protein